MNKKKKVEFLNELFGLLLSVNLAYLTDEEKVSLGENLYLLFVDATFDDFFDNILPLKHHINWKADLSVAREIYRDELPRLQALLENEIERVLSGRNQGIFWQSSIRIEVKCDIEDGLLSTKKYPPVYLMPDEMMIFLFYSAINGLSVENFRKCANPKCKRWFVHATRKEKKCCSNNCANSLWRLNKKVQTGKGGRNECKS